MRHVIRSVSGDNLVLYFSTILWLRLEQETVWVNINRERRGKRLPFEYRINWFMGIIKHQTVHPTPLTPTHPTHPHSSSPTPVHPKYFSTHPTHPKWCPTHPTSIQNNAPYTPTQPHSLNNVPSIQNNTYSN